MNKKLLRSMLSIFGTGLLMWIIAGLWHNLILPTMNENTQPHHEGIFIMLIAYFILSGLMTYIYTEIKKSSILLSGLKIGIIIGIVWVFPHGLAMAGAHQTSIVYEIQNTLWHCLEQGLGGVVIAFIKRNESFS